MKRKIVITGIVVLGVIVTALVLAGIFSKAPETSNAHYRTSVSPDGKLSIEPPERKTKVTFERRSPVTNAPAPPK